MTKEQLDHLRAIDAHLDALLALAAKRTPGEWESVSRAETSDIIGSDAICGGVYIASVSRIAWGEMDSEHGDANAAYIAACAGRAEAGWRSTKAAIAAIHGLTEVMEHEKEGLAYGLAEITRRVLAEPILAAWPRELLN